VRDASLRLEDHALDLVATAGQIDIELQRGEALLDVSIPLAVGIDDTIRLWIDDGGAETLRRLAAGGATLASASPYVALRLQTVTEKAR
jgi:hypothetical protein